MPQAHGQDQPKGVVCSGGWKRVRSSAYLRGGWQVGFLEPDVASMKVAPEWHPWRLLSRSFCHPLLRHAKGEDMHWNGCLTAVQGGFDDQIDLFDHWIGHGEASDAHVAAVHHDET